MRPSRLAARRAAGAGLAIAVMLIAGARADARPMTLEDLLAREAFGSVALDPGGRWLVFERQGPIGTAGRYDFESADVIVRTRLYRADLSHPSAPRPLDRVAPGQGETLGEASPDRRHLLVYRLSARGWELGVAMPAAGRMRWLGVTPERTPYARTVAWLSNDSVAVIARDDAPMVLRWRRNSALALPSRWAAAARGRASVTVVGSGRYQDINPAPPTRRLLRINVETGRRVPLARGAFVALATAPGGARLAVIEDGPGHALRADRPVQGPYGMALRARRLRLLDLRTGRLTTPCPTCDVTLAPLAWSPRGDELLMFARQGDVPWSDGALMRVDAARDRAAPLGGGIVPALSLRPEAAWAAWLGARPVVWGRPAGAPQARPDWNLPGGPGPVALTASLTAPAPDSLVLDQDGGWIVGDGAVRRLGPDGVLGPSLAATPAAAPLAALSAAAPFAPARLDHLAVVRSGGAMMLKRDGPGPALPLHGGDEVLAADGHGLVLRRSRSGEAVALVWRGVRGDERTIVTLNRSQADIRPPLVRAVKHTGLRGEPLTSWLLLPPTSRAGRRPPLIVWPYLGSSYPSFPDWMRTQAPEVNQLAALLTGAGYAVLLPSLPARPSGEDPAAGLAARVLAIIDAAAHDPALCGRFDPAALGVFGHSYGGYSTLAMITQSGRFKAAVAYAGVSDLVSMWGEFQPSLRADPREGLSPPYAEGWVEDLQGGMHAPPWADPQRYVRNSPLFHADEVTTPLLLLHGDQDGLPLGQAEEMFSALYRQNKDAVLATYWGEGHAVESPGNLRDLYGRVLSWFDTHLMASAGPASPTPAPDRACQ